MNTKEAIRTKILRQRLELRPQQIQQWSRAIQESVLGSEEYLKAERIALYAPFRNEVETDALLHKALADRKEVYYPQWNPAERSIRFFRVTDPESFQTSLWGIAEPIPDATHENRELLFDLILIPGVAFDLQAHRLGYGVGGYDRLLPRAQGVIWGLAFDLQLVDTLPIEPHDVACNQVITEKKIIKP